MIYVESMKCRAKNEQEFKMFFLRKNSIDYDSYFCIETEETCVGFPDVMVLWKDSEIPTFYEFKYAKKDGTIKFQKTQPSFMRKNGKKMRIRIVAYDAEEGKVYNIPSDYLFGESAQRSVEPDGTFDLRSIV